MTISSKNLLSELKNLHSSGKLSFDHDLIYNASGQASEFIDGFFC